MSEMDEIIREFLVESTEGLDQLDRDLVQLETEPDSAALLARIFRAVHTLKGTGGVLGFQRVEAVAHVGENLLSRLRDRKLQLNAEITSALLAMSDALRWQIHQIEQTGSDGERDFADVIAALTKLLDEGTEALPKPAEDLNSPATNGDSAEQSAGDTRALDQVSADSDDPPLLGEILVHNAAATPDDVSAALQQQQRGDLRKLGRILVEDGGVQPKAVLEALDMQGTARQEANSSSIRVDVGLLDKVMDLVGELVLARNQIVQFTAAQKDAGFLGTVQRLNLITTELQEGVMKTRMQPIGNVWNKLPRVVRDLSLNSGKKVRLDLEGSDTELDKTIIEAVKDPLTHIVRNAVDHGIEAPELRESAGKPAEGRLLLRAFHEGGQVNIDIIDDGAGINLDRVRSKAIARGLVTEQQAARMTDRELTNLIFLPGFSTATKVTNVSGRGVGMDVVKTNVEKIGGAVDVYSTPGQGTTLKIKIPLTLAIIPALVVTSGGERFAIPQVSLLELVRLDGEQAGNGIERIQGTPVYRLRGNLLPLVFLDAELGLSRDIGVAGQTRAANIVVLQADDRQFGLVVDEINDTEEIVVKPLGKQIKGIPTFAGATIMGDGQVALILDVLGLAQKAAVVSEVQDRKVAEVKADAATLEKRQHESWLVFQAGQSGFMAVPLAQVSRLEEFAPETIERTGEQEVVQYRGAIMPLIRVGGTLHVNSVCGTSTALQVIVYSDSHGSVGLVVDKILDVVEQQVVVEQRRKGRGLIGSAVIRERVTDLIDVPQLVAASQLRSELEARN